MRLFLLWLSVSLAFSLQAKEQFSEAFCKNEMKRAHDYLSGKKEFLFGLKQCSKDFGEELLEVNKEIKLVSDLVIECIDQLRTRGLSVEGQGPYFDAVIEIEHVRSRVDYMSRNPEASWMFVDDRFRSDFDEMMEALILQ